MAHQPSSGLDHPGLKTGQRPVLHRLRQHQPSQEVTSDDPHQMCSPGIPCGRSEARPMTARDADTLTFLEFFAGAGLVRLGLEPLWSCIWANDIDPRKQEVYEEWFGPGEFVLGDVGTVASDSLPIGADMAWASFPCQDLSLAGWRRGMKAERSGTFWEFWRLMHESMQRRERPPPLVIENVVGMLYGKDFAMLCEALATWGCSLGRLWLTLVCSFLSLGRAYSSLPLILASIARRSHTKKLLTLFHGSPRPSELPTSKRQLQYVGRGVGGLYQSHLSPSVQLRS